MKKLHFISLSLSFFLISCAPPLLAKEDLLNSARSAVTKLDTASTELVVAKSAKDRIKALSGTITAFEGALALLRASMRQIAVAKVNLRTNLILQEENISRLLGVLHSIDKEPITAKMIHPDGPLGTARAGMLLSDILPSLQLPIKELRYKLEKIKSIETLQKDANKILQNGLIELQNARSELALAMADRKDLPKRFIEDKSKTAILIAAADTMDTFISGIKILASQETAGSFPDIRERKGKLLFPVSGRVLREFKSADAAGIVRPGIIVATAPRALVKSPTAATLVYRGELLDYGLVSILEPQKDLLIIFSGLAEIFGTIGEVLPRGSPLGLMGGNAMKADNLTKGLMTTTGEYRTQTLYIEIREKETPQDPLLWFQVEKD